MKLFEKMNWKLFNLALWIEIILSYFLPFKITDSLRYKVGFPIPYLYMDNRDLDISPFMSMHCNPIGLLFNGIIIYILMIVGIKLYHRLKQKHIK